MTSIALGWLVFALCTAAALSLSILGVILKHRRRRDADDRKRMMLPTVEHWEGP